MTTTLTLDSAQLSADVQLAASPVGRIRIINAAGSVLVEYDCASGKVTLAPQVEVAEKADAT